MADNGKPKVAFFDFACCEGCQLTVVDALQTHLDLLDAVEITQFREAMTEKGEDYLVAFVHTPLASTHSRTYSLRCRECGSMFMATSGIGTTPTPLGPSAP
jgi:coenzyme F420-reducing hydrogenase gamma subunit